MRQALSTRRNNDTCARVNSLRLLTNCSSSTKPMPIQATGKGASNGTKTIRYGRPSSIMTKAASPSSLSSAASRMAEKSIGAASARRSRVEAVTSSSSDKSTMVSALMRLR